jgi:Trypsin-co-occurring domain 2
MKVAGMGGLELASVVRQLRVELAEALEAAEGERLRFELGPVELSLTVTVGREGTPGARVRFWVIEAGADAKISREAVQEIKLVLSPRDMEAPPGPDGGAPAPLITGGKLDGED